MKKKVAKGLLAAIVVANNVLGTTNLASAISDTAELKALSPITEEKVTVEAENNTTAITSEPEENGTVVLEESNNSDAIEENSTVAAVESNISDKVGKNKPESQAAEEIENTTDVPQIDSSSSINPSTEVSVSNES